MTSNDIETQGLDTLQGILHFAPRNATDYLVGAMFNVAMEVFAESQDEVPVRYGILKGSGHVDNPEVSGNEIEINIGYGGVATTYAAIVHERLDVYHAHPTKAKYLEDPMRRHADDLPKRLEGMESAVMTSNPSPMSVPVAMRGDASAGPGAVRRVGRRRAMTGAELDKRLSQLRTGRARRSR